MFSANTSQVSADQVYVEDVFSTYLYTGNGGTQTITNGIDLAGKGGLVWAKSRGSGTYSHQLYDTNRGATNVLATNNANAQATGVSNGLTAFTSSGFSIGSTLGINSSGDNVASWTFREAPKFFDVVTFSAGATAVPHSLGAVPGCFFIKRTDSAENWYVSHRSTGGFLYLNSTNAVMNAVNGNYVPATATTFDPSNLTSAGGTYVAYLFAHDTTSDGIIQCGSYTEPSSGETEFTLGWEPQWLLVKRTDSTSDWQIFDNMRAMSYTNSIPLLPNSSGAEFSFGDGYYKPTPRGFIVKSGAFGAGSSVVYIAIRRGPMRTPTSGTSVYNDVLTTGTGSNSRIITGYGFNPDMLIFGPRSESGYNRRIWDRLRNTILYTDTTSSEASVGLYGISRADIQDGYVQGTSDASGYNQSGTTWANFGFRRAPSFFDVVCYKGTGSALTLNHNLGATPEMVIVKSRSNTTNWAVYHSALGTGKWIPLNLTNAALTNASYWSAFTSTSMTLGTDPDVNAASTYTYVAYLFASCPGVSKVGSYTGNGSSQTINCGFAAGARFVMIKRTDSTGDWYVWDSARGIVAGNDPRLSLNSTAAEVTTDDSVDTDSSGFVVNQLSATNINVSSATYIYLAVA